MSWSDESDITQEILTDSGYTFLLVAPYLENADDSNIDRINELYDFCVANHYAFWCLTASNDETILRWQEMEGAEYPFAQADDVMLKTIVRSNPGLLLLKNGVVYNKWSCNDIPTEEQLTLPLEQSVLGTMQIESRMMIVLKVLLWFFIPLLIVVFLDRIWVGS